MPKIKTHCVNGHEFYGDNLFIRPSGAQGCRQCRYVRKTNYELKTRYGINSIAERDALLLSQNSACAICKRTDCTWGKGFENTWHIDHVHGAEGTHRGILCGRCNLALGRLEPFLRDVVAYLNNYGYINSKNCRHDGMGEAIKF
jgi:hypothetical protein